VIATIPKVHTTVLAIALSIGAALPMRFTPNISGASAPDSNAKQLRLLLALILCGYHYRCLISGGVKRSGWQRLAAQCRNQLADIAVVDQDFGASQIHGFDLKDRRVPSRHFHGNVISSICGEVVHTHPVNYH
jgi:hypothetical protein